MKKIVATIAVLMASPVMAQGTPTFQFDSNGGKCNSDYLYAQFGYEGMVYIDAGGSRYTPEGEFFIVDTITLKNGVYSYKVGDKFGNYFDFFVLPTGEFTTEKNYVKNPSLMKEEGFVDVIRLKPCH